MADQDPELLDRNGELEALTGALEAARAGRGGLLVIEANAGVGKSALVAKASELATGRGMRVLGARGGELEQEHPFGVVRQLYEPALGAVSAGERTRLLAGAAAPATALLGMTNGDSGVHAAGFATMHALYWLTAGLAADGPLLLTIDDAHWADPSSLRALDYQGRRIADLPVLVIAAFRPDEPGAHGALLDALRSAAGKRLIPAALRPNSVAQIVQASMPEADSGLCEACHTVTAGNPLYLHELLRTLSVDDAVRSAEAVSAASVRYLGDQVIRRVERVDADAPALARALAVLGNGSRLATAAELAAVPAGRAGQIAHQLRRIEILRAEDPVVFVHPLIRGSIYDALSEAERQSAHRGAARVLSAAGAPVEAVAAHLSKLTPGADVEVATTLRVAAERALERAAPDEAVVWLERALNELAPNPARVELLARLGTAKAIRRDPTAIATLREAYELADDPELRSRVAILLVEVLSQVGQWDRCVAMIEAIEAEPDSAEPERHAEVAAIRAAVTLHDPAHIDDFDRRREDYARLAELEHWASRALSALLAVEAANRGRMPEALALGEQARAGGRLLSERGAGSWASPHLVAPFVQADELDRALAVLAEVDAAARASGSAHALLTVLGFRAWINSRRGDLSAAVADLITVFEFARNADMLMGLTTASFLLVDVILEREDLSHIEAILETLELRPDFLATASGAMLLEPRGRLRLLRRERGRGIEDLRAAGRIFAALRFGPALSTWRSALALALPIEDRDEAYALATEELELARPTGLARPLGISLRTLGVLDEPRAGIELLRESVAVLEGSPARLERARSLVELGSALRRANQRTDARAPLVAGLRLAYQCGAQRLVHRAQRELQAAGGRRPRIATSGRDSLTASELRTAELAAAGATNIEIAQELYVSLKTVETHLSHAYAKLGLAGIGSRARLAQVLEPAA
jgi:DNA-binding CsgD family transcriptional regulator